jgi:hypothetical protein
MADVAYGNSYDNYPTSGATYVVLTADNAATAALGLYATNISPTGFTIASAVAPTASQPAGTYSATFVVIG